MGYSRIVLPDGKIVFLGDYNSIPYMDKGKFMFFSFIRREEIPGFHFSSNEISEYPKFNDTNWTKCFYFPLFDDLDPNENLLRYTISFHKLLIRCWNLGKIPYVHCALGLSRSPAMLCTFMIKQYGMSSNDAIEYLRRFRPRIRPNRKFVDELSKYSYIVNRGHRCAEAEILVH